MEEKNKFNWIIVSILVIAVAWLGFTTWDGVRQDQETKASGLKPGLAAPDFTLPDKEGSEKSLSDFQGKVVVLNFWASWCVYCKAEFPDLDAVYREMGGEDFVVLAVNAAAQDKAERANEFILDSNVTFPIIYDLEGSVVDLYQVRALPMTYIIDQEGIIDEVLVGGGVNELLISGKVKALLK